MALQTPLIGLMAGLASAALFASAATPTPLAVVLFYLAALPCYIAGLGWGHKTAAISGLAGSAVIGAVTGPIGAAVFGLTIALPVVVISYLALLARPAHEARGQAVAAAPPADANAVEWYPIGRLIMAMALLAAALACVGVLALGGTSATAYGEAFASLFERTVLKELGPDGPVAIDPARKGEVIALLSALMPAVTAFAWTLINVLNLWVASTILEKSGRALRPKPQFADMDIPGQWGLLLSISILLAMASGLIPILAGAVVGGLFAAYLVLGFVVLHAITRGNSLRPLILTASYTAVLLLGWVGVFVILLGLADAPFKLREKTRLTRNPPR